MDKLINMSLRLNKLWKEGHRNITSQPDYKTLLTQLPLPFPVTKFQKRFPDKISIKNLYMYGDLRVSMYLIPKGKIMQAHDHPDMFVLGHIMMGKTLLRSYTHKQRNIYIRKDSVLQKHQNTIIQDKQGNIHEFEALQNTLLFDILFPDYNDERPGTMYKQIRKIGDQQYILQQDHQPIIQMQQML